MSHGPSTPQYLAANPPDLATARAAQEELVHRGTERLGSQSGSRKAHPWASLSRSRPPHRRGSESYSVLGAVQRAREGMKPVYVSPGNRADLATAIRLTMACLRRCRLPQTSRWAHRLAAGHSRSRTERSRA